MKVNNLIVLASNCALASFDFTMTPRVPMAITSYLQSVTLPTGLLSGYGSKTSETATSTSSAATSTPDIATSTTASATETSTSSATETSTSSATETSTSSATETSTSSASTETSAGTAWPTSIPGHYHEGRRRGDHIFAVCGIQCRQVGEEAFVCEERCRSRGEAGFCRLKCEKKAHGGEYGNSELAHDHTMGFRCVKRCRSAYSD